ncbi:MAG: transferrin-binding protein-like solute binding protein, partial [Xanthomonadales bacterium]|nr:transferrin-binding protein-like solute binding protein [Xanthomonadales bacterium]
LGGQTSDGQTLPPHLTLVYGNEVQLTGNGAPQRLFQQGFSIVAGEGQPRVQRTPPQWVSGLQQVLAGRPGQSGGASNAPTEQTVASSPVAESNSAQLPSDNAIPVPTPRPIVTTPVEEVASTSQRAVGPQPQVQSGGSNDTGGSGGSGSDGGGGSDGDTETSVSVLSPSVAPGGGGPIASPGGGSNELRLAASQGTLTREADGTLSGTDGDGNSFTLPALSSTSVLAERTVSGSVNGTAVNGTAYTGSGGFFTYMLTAGNTDPKAFYVIGGTPADAQETLSTGEILSYVLEPDLLAALTNGSGTTIPFTGSFAESDEAVVSDLLVSGVSDTSDGVIGRALQASLVISGSGSAQKSAIGVLSGAFELKSGGYGLTASTAGSSREAANGSADHRQGLASSFGSTAGADHFLGADGEYLVIGAGSIDTMDETYQTPSFAGYEQLHVGSRDDNTSISGEKRLGGETLQGFAAGVMQDFGDERLLTGRVRLTPDADSGTVSARFASDGGTEYADLYSSDADSAYLSDQLMAATNHEQGSYMVSSGVVEAKIFDGGNSSQICNTCEFMTWGWWGRNRAGEVPYEVHLGNWIVGVNPEAIDMPPSGSATYAGHAVGTVMNGTNRYIATGELDATMDFGTRTGTISVGGFDGRDFSTSVSFDNNGAPKATFAGSSSGNIDMSVSGAFAQGPGGFDMPPDPVKGIMGNFTASDGNGWSSSGIFAGSR